jgi:hypothetical protein
MIISVVRIIPQDIGSRTISMLNNPGVWTRTSVTVIPLPGGMLLFGSALGGLWLNRRIQSASKR